jgi:hypothetical protein
VSDTPEDRANQWRVETWQDKHLCPECRIHHWNARAIDWEAVLYPNGETERDIPYAGDEMTEQEAIDSCRKEMANSFRKGGTPIAWDHPAFRKIVERELRARGE